MGRRVRHRQPKGSATAGSPLHHRATLDSTMSLHATRSRRMRMENSHCTPIRNAIDLVILRTRTSPSRRSDLGYRAPSRSRRITMIGAMGASSSDCTRPLRRHGKPGRGKPVKHGGGAPRWPVCLRGSKTRQRLASQTGHTRKEGGAADVPRRTLPTESLPEGCPVGSRQELRGGAWLLLRCARLPGGLRRFRPRREEDLVRGRQPRRLSSSSPIR